MSEADAVEMALQESRQMGEGRWIDLVKKAHLGRTIVSGQADLALVVNSVQLTSQIATVTFFFNQTTGQQFANSYGPT